MRNMRTIKHTLNKFSTVIITGGSSGIGSSYLHSILSIEEVNVVCNLSRNKPEIYFEPKCPFHYLECDLSDLDQISSTVELIHKIIFESKKRGPILLINNSGFGSYGPFEGSNLKNELNMVDVNIKGVLALTHQLMTTLKECEGAIMNIASITSFFPTPYVSNYGATKPFLLNWSLALNAELKGSGVHVMAVCPGPTTTQFSKRAGLGKSNAVTPKRSAQTPEEVVKESFKALT